MYVVQLKNKERSICLVAYDLLCMWPTYVAGKSASTEERLQALESTQQTILAQLKRIEDKVDCIVRALEI